MAADELLPLDALAASLRCHVHDFPGPLQVAPLTGGQSEPTYRMAEAGWRQVQRVQAGT